MKKIILLLGFALFTSVFALHVKVSTDNPMQLATEEALAYGTFVTGCHSQANCQAFMNTYAMYGLIRCCMRHSMHSTGNKSD